MSLIANITLLVHHYDDAIAFYTEKLGFDLLEDTDLGGGKRWVRVAPKQHNGTALLLAKASTAQQQRSVGAQAGDRVWLFLHTDDFWTDYHAMLDAGVTFLQQPRQESYATVVVFSDLYGNKWDLLQRRS